MGNKFGKQEKKKEEFLLKVEAPVNPTYRRWLTKELERIYGFPPLNPQTIEPPDHYMEGMRLNGWLDVDMDDPDLAHLFK